MENKKRQHMNVLTPVSNNHQSIAEIIVIVKISSCKLPWQFIPGSMSYIPGWELRSCVPQGIAKKKKKKKFKSNSFGEKKNQHYFLKLCPFFPSFENQTLKN